MVIDCDPRKSRTVPGRDVRRKAGLDLRMLDVAPGEIRRQPDYRPARTGRLVVAVSPAYAGQDRSACGTRGHAERDGRTFTCEACGAVVGRATYAARNICARAITEPAAGPAEAARGSRREGG